MSWSYSSLDFGVAGLALAGVASASVQLADMFQRNHAALAAAPHDVKPADVKVVDVKPVDDGAAPGAADAQQRPTMLLLAARLAALLGLGATWLACTAALARWADDRMSVWTGPQIVALTYGYMLAMPIVFPRFPSFCLTERFKPLHFRIQVCGQLALASVMATMYYICAPADKATYMSGQVAAAWVMLVMMHCRIGAGTQSTVFGTLGTAIVLDLARYFCGSAPGKVNLGFLTAMNTAIPGFLIASNLRYDRASARAHAASALTSAPPQRLCMLSFVGLAAHSFAPLALAAAGKPLPDSRAPATVAVIVALVCSAGAASLRKRVQLRAWWAYKETWLRSKDDPMVFMIIAAALPRADQVVLQ